MKVYFKKLYHRIEELPIGAVKDAVVLHHKVPYEIQTGDVNEFHQERVTKYQHRILIDLWLFKIHHEWISEIPYAKAEKLRPR